MPANSKHLLLLLIALFIGLSFYFSDQLTLENIKHNKLSIREFISHYYLFSVLLFFTSCVVFVNSPLPLAAFIKVLGGFFFGFLPGLLYNISATVVACLVGFLISRYGFKSAFEDAYYEKIKTVETEIENNGFYYFLSLRLAMVVPYFLINIMAGISRVSFKDYLFSTVLGVIPASLIYANGGSRLEQINSLSELFKTDVIVAITLVALFALSPIVLRKR